MEKEGIVIVRMDDEEEAKEFGIDELPTLMYIENKLPAIYEGKFGLKKKKKINNASFFKNNFLIVLGDLFNEDEVLEWLIEQKNSATIEEITDEILEDLIAEHEYVVVYFCK